MNDTMTGREAADKLTRHLSEYLYPLGNGALGVVVGNAEYKAAMDKFNEACLAGDEQGMKDTGNAVFRVVKSIVHKEGNRV